MSKTADGSVDSSSFCMLVSTFVRLTTLWQETELLLLIDLAFCCQSCHCGKRSKTKQHNYKQYLQAGNQQCIPVMTRAHIAGPHSGMSARLCCRPGILLASE